MEDTLTHNLVLILITLFLVILNAFFVAAEFALIKLRKSQLKALIRDKRPFSKTAEWLLKNLNNSLSACQLGITMASLGLGWIGEPALARLIEGPMQSLGVTSATTIHSTAFIFAFTCITALHIVVGEQAPKLLAITRPEVTTLACALPLKIFYILTFPFMWSLNKASDLLLKVVGLDLESESHESVLSVEEIRAQLTQAHATGRITQGKHQLLEAIFELDTRLARQIMVPRPDLAFFKTGQDLESCLALARQTRHTRFPLCKESLEDLVGVIHVKDLLGLSPGLPLDLESLARPPLFVPETLPAGQLIRKFQASKQHMAFVLDEHGSIQGMVTMENALEELIGDVQDEFDNEAPRIVPCGEGSYDVSGHTSLDEINDKLGTTLPTHQVDTLSGLLFQEAGRLLRVGDRLELDELLAEVLEMRASRAWKIRLSPKPRRPDQDAQPPSS